MFGELPKVFDRDFAIGFFIPALAFVAANLGILPAFGLALGLFPLFKEDALGNATLIGITSWSMGIMLLVANYPIYRLLEGYGAYNPAKLLKRLEEHRYRRLHGTIEQVGEEINYAKYVREEAVVIDRLRDRLSELTATAAERFPKDEARLLPTAFGNTLRAFEDYPYDMYRVDSIVGWVRLMAVIPKSYREQVNAAKSQTDLWANLWAISYILLIEYFFLAIFRGRLPIPWLPILIILFVLWTPKMARGAALVWGDFVKSSFDVFLPKLRAAIQLPVPTDIEHERKIWDSFSQVIVHHRAEAVSSRVDSFSEVIVHHRVEDVLSGVPTVYNVKVNASDSAAAGSGGDIEDE